MTAIELHDYRLEGCTFTFQEAVSLSRTASGKAVSRVEYGDPHLRARFLTWNLRVDDRHGWEAWKDSLRGGMRSFLAWDASRPEPLAYLSGVPDIIAGTWDGEGTVSALSAYQITAAGAPEGFQLRAGDHVGLVENDRYGLFRIEANTTAGASTMVVNVNPAVPPGYFTTAATVVFRRPKAEFILLSDTWSNPMDRLFSPISFEGVQKL